MKNKIAPIVCALALLLTGTPAWCAPDPPPAPAAAAPTDLPGEAQSALDSGDFERAIALAAAAIAARPGEAHAYWVRAQALGEGRRDYEAALADLSRVNDLSPRFGPAWNSRGWYLILAGRFAQARQPLLQARELLPWEAATTANLGHAELLRGDPRGARAWYELTLALSADRAQLERGPIADLKTFIARGWEPAACRDALAFFERAGPAAVAANGPVFAAWRESDRLWDQGAALEREGRNAAAAAAYAAAAGAERGSGRPRGLAARLDRAGALYRRAGLPALAEPLHREALTISRAALPAGHRDIAAAQGNLAAALRALGRYGEAEPLLREAIGALKTAGPASAPDLAASENDLALLLKTLGRTAESESLYRESLRLRIATLPPGHPDIPQGMNNLAVLLAATGRPQEAAALLRESLRMRRAARPPDPAAIARSLNALAGALDLNGCGDEALGLYREALAIGRPALPAEHPDIAAWLNNLAACLRLAGRGGESGPLYREALAIADRAADPQLSWTVQGNLADLYAGLGQTDLAIFYGKRAVNALQSARRSLASASQDDREAFLKGKDGYYRDLAGLLIARARLTEAGQVMAMLKEHELYELIRRDGAQDPRRTRASYNAFESGQDALYESSRGELARLAAEYRSLADRDAFDLGPDEEARKAALESRLAAANRGFQQTLEGIEASFGRLGEERRMELAERQLLVGKNDRGLVRDLGQGVALLGTLVLEDKTHLLLTLPELMLARECPRGEAQIGAEVQALREALQDPRSDPRPAAQALYRCLIEPVAADLEAAGVRTLMVSLDGALRYLPLAALHDGQRWLVERYATSVFSDLARDNLLQAPRPAWTAIGLGVSQAHAGVGPLHDDFGALPMVPAELDGIIRREHSADPDGVLPGRFFLDGAFDTAVLRKSLQFPVVHLASHFRLQPGNESASFLLLGDGSTLELRQIREGNYDFSRIELLTLSACDTALGGPNARGQEVEGLGALAQRQGAKSVLATLWPVADQGTGLFMQRFYRLRQERHLSKAQALRDAQLAFLGLGDEPLRAGGSAPAPATRRPVQLNSGGGADTSDAARSAPPPAALSAFPYAHPYYWAPFVLMGNWL